MSTGLLWTRSVLTDETDVMNEDAWCVGQMVLTERRIISTVGTDALFVNEL